MDPQLDILLLSAGYGDGHHQVARAVEENLRLLRKDCEARMVDYLEYVPDFIEQTTVSIYKVLSKHSPWAYGGVYHLTSQMAGMWGWSHIEYSIGRQHLRDLLSETRPKAIVCSHPLPMAVLATMRRQGEQLPPVFGVITDYVLHREWVQPLLDGYYVASETVRAELVSRGLDERLVYVSGIPVRRAFAEASKGQSATAARQALGWPEVPTVLFITSALGTLGGVQDACETLVSSAHPFRLVVVCGRDAALADKLNALAAKVNTTAAASSLPGPRLQVLGYADNIAQLMSASDVIVTKAGGVTLSEALALERTIVIYRPIPGQEAGNCRFAADHGAALVAKSPDSLLAIIEDLLQDDHRRAEMARAAAKLGHPDAALRIAGDVLTAAVSRSLQPT